MDEQVAVVIGGADGGALVSLSSLNARQPVLDFNGGAHMMRYPALRSHIEALQQ